RARHTWRARSAVVSNTGRSRASGGVAAGPHMKRGERMRSVLNGRERRRGRAKILGSAGSGSGRERLLHAACNAGLEASMVVAVAEALTGRPWACIRSPEMATVARELLSAANRVALRPTDGAPPCAK